MNDDHEDEQSKDDKDDADSHSHNPRGNNMKATATHSKKSSSGNDLSKSSTDSSSKNCGGAVNAELFFSDLLRDEAQKKTEFLALSFSQQFDLCAHCVSELDFEVMECLFNRLIPANKLNDFLRHDNFILFEHGLSDSCEFYFLLEQLGAETQNFLTYNAGH